jgi:hypothetical protein
MSRGDCSPSDRSDSKSSRDGTTERLSAGPSFHVALGFLAGNRKYGALRYVVL